MMGMFLDGNFALVFIASQLKCVAKSRWVSRHCLEKLCWTSDSVG